MAWRRFGGLGEIGVEAHRNDADQQPPHVGDHEPGGRARDEAIRLEIGERREFLGEVLRELDTKAPRIAA